MIHPSYSYEIAQLFLPFNFLKNFKAVIRNMLFLKIFVKLINAEHFIIRGTATQKLFIIHLKIRSRLMNNEWWILKNE